MRNLSAYFCVSLVLACSRSGGEGSAGASSNAPTAMPAASSIPPSATPAEGTTSSSPAAAPAPAAASDMPASDTAPASFDGGQKETIGGAIGLGCEAKSSAGWLELLCRRRNGTGGHPVRALLRTPGVEPTPNADAEPGDADAGNGDEVLPSEKGELRLVVPFRAGEKREIEMTWTDVRHTLKLDGASGGFEWAGVALPHRRECQALFDANRAALASAQKGPPSAEILSPNEVKGLSKLGTCQPGGLGSWALSLRQARGAGEPNARSVKLDLDVVRIDLDGKRLTAPFGSLEVAPGGFDLGPLVVYDYDDDGNDEVIVTYDVKALPASVKEPPAIPAVWSFSASGITPYAKGPKLSGGVSIEQLDFDMRPDLGTSAPFLGYLGSDCGQKTCGPRVSGPKLFFHSLPDGDFSENDDAARDALKRTCSSKPAAILAGGAGNVNLERTAKNLVCSRAHGASAESIKSELGAKSADLCGERATCPLATLLDGWASAAMPVTLK